MHILTYGYIRQSTHCTHRLFALHSTSSSFHFFSCRNQGASINLEKVERGLQKIKKGALPVIPSTVDEINEAFSKECVFDTYGSTLQTIDLDGRDLEKKHSFFDGAFENKAKQFSFCVFSSKATIQLIKRHIPVHQRHILMDATFRVVPMGKFKQLFILYIRKHKKVLFHYIL